MKLALTENLHIMVLTSLLMFIIQTFTKSSHVYKPRKLQDVERNSKLFKSLSNVDM